MTTPPTTEPTAGSSPADALPGGAQPTATGAGDNPAAAGGNAQAAPGDQGGAEGAPARPDWAPEKFWKDGALNAEGLAQSYRELERRMGERAQKAPEAYQLPKGFEVLEQALPKEQRAALDNLARVEGFSQQGYGELVRALFPDVTREQEALRSHYGDKFEPTLQAVASYAKTFGEEHAEAVAILTSSAAGVRLLDAMRQKSGTSQTPGDQGNTAGAPGTGPTEAEVRQMMNDPRYHDPKKRDPAFVAQVEAAFRKLYPGSTPAAALNPSSGAA